jgi:RimJ/RimL family protein N-acetyltransferase
MTLRDVHEDDLPILFEHQRDPDATRMASFPSRDWEAFHGHWITKVLGDASVKKKTVLAGGCAAGYVVSWERDGRRLVGFWIAKEHWGKGVATAALTEFLACETTRPLYAFVARDNAGSIRVLEKCGFAVADAERAAERSSQTDLEELLMKLSEASG